MKDFFDALSEFLGSDLARDYRLVFIIAIIICIVLAVVITSFFFTKIIIPLRLREAGDVKLIYENALNENKQLKEEIGRLESELIKYRQIKKMQEAINDPEESISCTDSALNIFLKK